MKTTLTSLPGMYADWNTLGWSMLLGKPPVGAAMQPTLNPGQVAPIHEQVKQAASAKPPKKAKPAAKKAKAKPAAKRTLKAKARRAAPAKKRRVSAKRR
jgi:hypothetical protein